MDDEQLARLEQRVLRLEQVEDAREIHHLYARALDVPEPATVARLFTEDGSLATPVGEFVGRDGIEQFFRDAFAADPSVKRHFITNPSVESVADGVVVLRSAFWFVGRGDKSYLGWGTYVDHVDVTGPEPRLRRKVIEMQAATDLERGWRARRPRDESTRQGGATDA